MNMQASDAYMAAIGGLLIAISSSLHYYLYGRITGMSGMLFNVVGFKFGPLFPLRTCFVIGLITIVDLLHLFVGDTLNGQKVLGYDNLEVNLPALIFGGLFIGLGVRFGGGCTSGHGVCGLPRKSKRSLIAVAMFMTTAIMTATIIYYAPTSPFVYSKNSTAEEYYSYIPRAILSLYQLGFIVLIIYNLFATMSLIDKFSPILYFLFGIIFGLGLLISGMCSRAKILNFLTLSSNWDPSLLIVMAVAVGFNFVTFQLVIKKGKPVFGEELDMPLVNMDAAIFIGPAIFGIGWGITGLCPGPALANITVLTSALPLVILIYIGQHMHDFIELKYITKVQQE